MSAHVIGVDPSLTGCGVAHFTDTQRIYTWVKGTEPLPDNAPVSATSDRIRSIWRWLFDPDINLVNAATVLAMVEEPIKATHGGAGYGQPIERHWLYGRIIDGFRHRGIPVVAINPTWVKGYMAGSGNAKKADVQRAIARAFPGQGLARISDNEADAATLATMGGDRLGWPGPWLEGRRGSGWLEKACWPDLDDIRIAAPVLAPVAVPAFQEPR